MLYLIADASTQPDLTTWSPAATIAVIGAVATALVTIAGAVTAAVMAWRANTKATEAKAGNEAVQQSVTRLSARQNADAATVATTLKAMPPNGPSPLLLLPLLLIPFVVGCGTSASYKAFVSETYPTIANRMDKYPLTEQEKGEVATLRQVSAKRADVRYEAARPAWEAVSPDYRRYVSEDSAEHLAPGKTLAEQERRRSDWLHTAELIDQAQEAEAESHRGLFGN